MPDPIAVYLHTPFCPTKCGYCDFSSFAMTGAIHERTVRAIVQEVRASPLRGRPAKTIFFGGGTPTYLAVDQLHRLLDAVREVHPPAADCEITSEANPGTVDIPKFAAMREMGFNRISMGAQSFLDSDLERLGRVHRSAEIERAFRAAREAGFENVNLDLMFALPGQEMEGWRANLERAIALGPEHLSLYCLTLEPNTPFYKEHRAGRLVVPDDDVQVEMYDLAVSMAAAAGYGQYEISNFARPGLECRHNLAYWRYEEYAGYGPGAVGCFDCGLRISDCGLGDSDSGLRTADSGSCGDRGGRRVRCTNLKHPVRYCEAFEALTSPLEGEVGEQSEPGDGASQAPRRNLHPLAPFPNSSLRSEHGEWGPLPPSFPSGPSAFDLRSSTFVPSSLWCEWEELDAPTQRLERIMLGIRMNEGLPIASLGLSEPEISHLKSEISNLAAKGWVSFDGKVLKLTADGRHWCSEAALRLA